jgi:hypothetical protein
MTQRTPDQQSTFTPGPWTIEDGEFLAYIHGGGDTERIVAEIDEAQGNQVADANLIAAAPELYEALRQVVATMRNWQVNGWYDSGLDALAEAALKKARLTKDHK